MSIKKLLIDKAEYLKTFHDDVTCNLLNTIDLASTGVISGVDLILTGDVGCQNVNAAVNVNCVNVNCFDLGCQNVNAVVDVNCVDVNCDNVNATDLITAVDFDLDGQVSTEGDIMIKDASNNFVWRKAHTFEQDFSDHPDTGLPFTTNSAAPVVVSTFNTNNLETGRYRIDFYFEMFNSGAISECYIENLSVPKIYSGFSLLQHNVFTGLSGFIFANLTGSQNITFNGNTTNVGFPTEIQNVRLAVTRVA